MKRLANVARLCRLVVVVTALLVAGATARGEESATQSDLESLLHDIVARVEETTRQQNTLLRRSRVLSDRIDSAKRDRADDGDPSGDRALQRDLRSARLVADQLQGLDASIYALTQEGVATRKAIMARLDDAIARAIARSDAAVTSEERERILADAIALRSERDVHATYVRAQSRELLLGLDVTVADTDGPDVIAQKIEVVQDQLDIVDEGIVALAAEILAAEEKLSLLRGMLELLQELRRSEDDEIDLDRPLRAAELEGNMSELSNEVLALRARQERRRAGISPLRAKLARFQAIASEMLRPAELGKDD